MRPLSAEEVEALVSKAHDRYKAAVIVAAGTGMRLSEVLGLTVENVNFLRREITVAHQLVTGGKGQPFLAATKTDTSHRTIRVGSHVIDALAAHLAKFPPKEQAVRDQRKPNAEPAIVSLVFVNTEGRPLRRNTFIDSFSRTAREAEVSATFHSLRHYFASVLISNGVSVKAVQSILGHSSAMVTLDTYAHLFDSEEDKAPAAIDAVFGRTAEALSPPALRYPARCLCATVAWAGRRKTVPVDRNSGRPYEVGWLFGIVVLGLATRYFGFIGFVVVAAVEIAVVVSVFRDIRADRQPQPVATSTSAGGGAPSSSLQVPVHSPIRRNEVLAGMESPVFLAGSRAYLRVAPDMSAAAMVNGVVSSGTAVQFNLRIENPWPHPSLVAIEVCDVDPDGFDEDDEGWNFGDKTIEVTPGESTHSVTVQMESEVATDAVFIDIDFQPLVPNSSLRFRSPV